MIYIFPFLGLNCLLNQDNMFLPPVLLLVLTVSNLVLGVVETQGGHGVQTPLREKRAQLPPREGKKGGWMDTLLSIATGRGYQQQGTY